MQSLRSCNVSQLQKKLRQKNLLLLFDFDGVLSPIVSHPHRAAIPPSRKKWIQKLTKNKRVKIGIVTGRSLKDIRKRLGLRGVLYAANHGLEIYYRKTHLLQKGKSFQKPIKELGRKLESRLKKIPGLFIEKKGFSVSIHYRQVPKKYHAALKKEVYLMARPWLKKYQLQLTGGKKIWEIRPARFWNKGKAVEWIYRNWAPRSFPIYVGDDVTDEDAFKAVKRSGMTIRVGYWSASKAQYYVKDFQEFQQWFTFMR